MIFEADINMVAVLVAAVANMAVGFVWYMPQVFGTMWMELAGIKPKNKSEEAEMTKNAQPAMIGSFVSALVMAYVLAHLVDFLGITTAMEGAQLAFWIWLGFQFTTGVSDTLFQGQKMQLLYINAGFKLVSLMAMAAVLAVWT